MENTNDFFKGPIPTIILNVLSSGDKYGYEIIKEAEEKSNGKIIIKQPSLYSCLKRLESQKLISSYWMDSDIGGKRHYYRISDMGKKQLEYNKRGGIKYVEKTYFANDFSYISCWHRFI